MARKSSIVPAWLKARIQEHGSLIGEASIFGSMAIGSPKPSDCDLLVIAAHSHESFEWRALQTAVDGWKSAFQGEFGLPLSVVLLTPREKKELSLMFSGTWPPREVVLRRGSAKAGTAAAGP